MTLPSSAALAAAVLVARRTGIAVGIFPADDTSNIEVQRAPDDGLGAPNEAAATTAAVLPPGSTLFVDGQVLNGARWHYRIRATGILGDPSDWTGWVSAIAAALAPDVRRPDAVLPAIIATTTATTTDVHLALEVEDPQHRITSVEFRTKVGAGAWSAWAEDAASPYEATVTLTGEAGAGSRIGWRINGYNAAGALEILREGESLWPVNRGVNRTITKLTRVNYDSVNGRYQIWYRYFLERGNDELDEDPTFNDALIVFHGPENITDQSGAAAANVTRGGAKEADGWPASWDSTSAQVWTFELEVVPSYEEVVFPIGGTGDPDVVTTPFPTARATTTHVVPAGAASGGASLEALTFGSYLAGSASSYNGSLAVSLAVEADTANTALTVVARDATGGFAAGTVDLAGLNVTGSATFTGSPVIFGVDPGGAERVRIGGGLRVSSFLTVEDGLVVEGTSSFTGIVGASISGSANTLATTRTIWGQNFNGSANVSGALTGVTDIVASSGLNAAIVALTQNGFTTHVTSNASGSYVNAIGATNSFRVLLDSVAALTVSSTLVTTTKAIWVTGGEGAVNATAGSVVLGGGGTSPLAGSLCFGDGSGWEFRMGTKSGGVFSVLFTFSDTGVLVVGSDPGGSEKVRVSGAVRATNFVLA